MNYRVVTPNNQQSITLGLPYGGNITLTDGQILPESNFTKTFPDFFKPIEEPVVMKSQPEMKVEHITVTDITEQIKKDLQPEVPVKRKAGRPPYKHLLNKK